MCTRRQDGGIGEALDSGWKGAVEGVGGGSGVSPLAPVPLVPVPLVSVLVLPLRFKATPAQTTTHRLAGTAPHADCGNG